MQPASEFRLTLQGVFSELCFFASIGVSSIDFMFNYSTLFVQNRLRGNPDSEGL